MEITIAASIVSAVLAASVAWLVKKAPAPEVIEVMVPMALETVQLATVDSAHQHEATTFDRTGWHCECGQHKHVYMFKVEGEEEIKRCVCGKTGIGKEWS